jgi:uncharacterized protein (TIGR00266 family)
MNYEIKHGPSYAMLHVNLDTGERVTAESGAMTYMTPNIDVETRWRERGILESVGLSIFGRQSLFVNDYIAKGGAGKVALAAAPVGDIKKLEVSHGSGYVIQKAAFLASTNDLDLDVKWEGFSKGIFGQGLFMIKVSGDGDLFINTFGAIEKHELDHGEELVVDNFHLVAFTDSCDYEVRKIGSWRETILSGEGLVTYIRGPGEVYIQTKNLREFVNWLWVLLSPRMQGSRAR